MFIRQYHDYPDAISAAVAEAKDLQAQGTFARYVVHQDRKTPLGGGLYPALLLVELTEEARRTHLRQFPEADPTYEPVIIGLYEPITGYILKSCIDASTLEESMNTMASIITSTRKREPFRIPGMSESDLSDPEREADLAAFDRVIAYAGREASAHFEAGVAAGLLVSLRRLREDLLRSRDQATPRLDPPTLSRFPSS